MKCYLCESDQHTYKFGSHNICWDCKARTDRARRKTKIGSLYHLSLEKQISKLQLLLVQNNSK